MADLKLNLRESGEFERLTGRPFLALAKKFSPAVCKPHRLMIAACPACAATQGLACDEHKGDYAACPDCEGPSAPDIAWAALGYILRRRGQPDLTFEAYCEDNGVAEAIADVGNA